MKTITLLIMVAMSTIGFSQNDKSIQDLKKANKSQILLGAQLLEYVDFVQDFTAFQNDGNVPKPMTIQLVNHHPTKKLLPAYLINGKEYSDTGKNHDKVAGDGIFTSVQKVTVQGLPRDVTKIHNFSPTYTGNTSRIIKFGCKTRLVTCPETSWVNSCWPMSSPCYCIEFYDCEFEIEL